PLGRPLLPTAGRRPEAEDGVGVEVDDDVEGALVPPVAAAVHPGTAGVVPVGGELAAVLVDDDELPVRALGDGGHGGPPLLHVGAAGHDDAGAVAPLGVVADEDLVVLRAVGQ